MYIKWDITYKCNLMCNHCINGEYLNNYTSEITLCQVQEIIEKISKNVKIDYIHFLGGEPLTRPDFIEILRLLDSKSIKCGFNSNGLLLNEKTIERIMELKNVESIVLSLEGHNAELNDMIRGKNVFNIIINRIKALNNSKHKHNANNLKICVNTVVTKQNYKYLDRIIELCEEMQVDEISLLEFIEEGNGIGKGLSLSVGENIEAIENLAKIYSEKKYKINIIPRFARPLAKDYANQILGLSFPSIEHGCGAGATAMFIDNEGMVSSCDRARKICEKPQDLKTESFEKILMSEEFEKPFSIYCGSKKYKNLYPCNTCKYLYNECFPCYLEVNEKMNTYMPVCWAIESRLESINKAQ